MKTARIAGVLGLALIALTENADAQDSAGSAFALELRAAAVVPTFDIADAADLGPGFGLGVGYRVAPKVRLMADFDVGLHPADADPDFKINTYHYMGKVGYDVFVGDRVTVAVNLGAGMVQFGGDLPETKSYPAINAGAKVAIALSNSIDLLISPQGDIAFTEEADLGTTNAWVWPFGAGLRINF
jgi:hypothetical protein